MSMLFYSRGPDEAVRLRDLFLNALPSFGVVTDCITVDDPVTLSRVAMDEDFRYALLCCADNSDLLLAAALLRLNPSCRVALVTADEDAAVKSYRISPRYCCRAPVNMDKANTIIRRLTA